MPNSYMVEGRVGDRFYRAKITRREGDFRIFLYFYDSAGKVVALVGQRHLLTARHLNDAIFLAVVSVLEAFTDVDIDAIHVEIVSR